MSKAVKYGLNGLALGAVTFGIIDAVKQHIEMGENPGQKFEWSRLLKASATGGILFGAGGLALGAIVDHQNSQEEPIDTDFELVTLANELMLNNNSNHDYLKLSREVEVIMGMLRSHYGDRIVSTPRYGSTENGTALWEKFDIDFGVNFRHNAFRSISVMYDSVYEFFESSVGVNCITNVRRQGKSIGVFVMVEGFEHRIDVTPCKLSKGKKDGSGYVQVNDHSLLGTSTYTKTNIRVLKSIKLSPAQKKIVIVLKEWKLNNNLPLSSNLLQNLVLDAHAYAHCVPRKFTSKIVMVFQYIVDNLNFAVIRGAENTNNVLTNISESDKQTIIDAAKVALEDYAYQPNSIVTAIASRN